MERRLEWQVQPVGIQLTVTLSGQINEDAHLPDLLGQLKDYRRIVFDMEKVSRINSIGVREWVNFARSIPAEKEVVLSRCSPAIVAQLNMIRNFANGARIESVCTPYVCDACSQEASVVVDLPDRQAPTLAQVVCENCGGHMEMDDFRSNYFAFLNHVDPPRASWTPSIR